MKYLLNPLDPNIEPVSFDTQSILDLALLGAYDKDTGVIYFDGVACFEPTSPASTPAYIRELEAELLAMKNERDNLLKILDAVLDVDSDISQALPVGIYPLDYLPFWAKDLLAAAKATA